MLEIIKCMLLITIIFSMLAIINEAFIFNEILGLMLTIAFCIFSLSYISIIKILK